MADEKGEGKKCAKSNGCEEEGARIFLKENDWQASNLWQAGGLLMFPGGSCTLMCCAGFTIQAGRTAFFGGDLLAQGIEPAVRSALAVIRIYNAHVALAGALSAARARTLVPPL